MEPQIQAEQLLEHIDRPAFCVSGGIIKAANQAALDRLIPLQQPVAPLIATAQEEYAAFTDGILSLTLRIGDTPWIASVYNVGTFHLFKLEPRKADSELQALALAAQKLREPLTRIMSITEHLFPKLELQPNSPAEDQVSHINRGLHQMLRIIGNMSDAARYTNDPPRMETRDVDAVLRELFEQAAVLCEFSGIRLEYTGLSSPAYSLIDSEQLERSIYNILSNSLKYTPAGGKIQAKLTRRGNTLYLVIQDSGSGMGGSGIGDLFDRFLREPAVEESRQGIGLGLALVRACANIHGGTVLLDSSDGQGLRLTMSLPIRLDNTLRSPILRIDYAGERNHGLIELSESLPPELYKPQKKN